MRLSRAFLPTLKETPTEAQIASHRLMLRAGMIRQTSAGIYAWLPLGWRALQKVEQIVRECARGLSPAEVASQYARVEADDVLAALAFAADYLSHETIVAAE